MNDIRIFASCHNHSNFSDAEYSPELLARMAWNMGHGGIILTDHDTVRGYPFIKAECDKRGLKTMLGCEFSTYHKNVGTHVCGFDFDPEYPKIKELLRKGAGYQTERSRLMFEWGMERGTLRRGITWQNVLDDHPENDYFCNNQIFDSMVRRGIYLPSEYDDAFMKPNFSHSLGLEPRIREQIGYSYRDISTEYVVKTIKEAGGIPVIAHPHHRREVVEDYLAMGVMGFETRHSTLSPDEHQFYEKLCEEKGLYKTGGSDHEGILGGLLAFDDPVYDCPYEYSGVCEEDFMTLYERRLG